MVLGQKTCQYELLFSDVYNNFQLLEIHHYVDILVLFSHFIIIVQILIPNITFEFEKMQPLCQKNKWITFVPSEVETQPSGPPKWVRIFSVFFKWHMLRKSLLQLK